MDGQRRRSGEGRQSPLSGPPEAPPETHIESYAAFWPHYLRQHRKRGTRALHYLGTALALVLIGAGLIAGKPMLFLFAPVVGYGCAWSGHALSEGNRPATFGHPLWSLISDLRMLALALTGKLAPELRRAGIP